MPTGAPLHPGTVLDDRYRLIAPLGRGGMAEVWRAVDQRLDRPVAIKIFHDDLDEPAALARQQAEIRALSDISHPNLVSFLDARHATAAPIAGGGRTIAYLVMEFVDGPTLADRLQQGPLSAAEVRDIARGVGGALAAAHSRGLVHRDVKPANILLSRDEHGRTVPKLTDFGIAQRLGAGRITRTAMVVGTAAYLSPEQARGAEVGPSSDVYSLGLVLLETITGRREYEGTPLEVAAARLHRAPRVPTTLPAPWPELLTAMTQLTPTSRPAASVVVGVLEGRARIPHRPATGLTAATPAAVTTAPVTAGPAGPVVGPRHAAPLGPPPATRNDKRSRGLAAAIAIVAVIALAALAFTILRGRQNPSGGDSTVPASTRPSSPAASSQQVSTPSSTQQTTPNDTTTQTTTTDTTTSDTTTSDSTSTDTTTTETTTSDQGNGDGQ